MSGDDTLDQFLADQRARVRELAKQSARRVQRARERAHRELTQSPITIRELHISRGHALGAVKPRLDQLDNDWPG